MNGRNVLVLLIQDDEPGVELVREAVTRGGEGSLRVQCIKSLPTALARIAGGGVDAVVLDLAARSRGRVEALEAVRQIRAGAPRAPLLALCAAADEALGVRAIRAGATDYVVRERCLETLGPALQSALSAERSRSEHLEQQPAAPRRGGVIAFVGAKGGVGTTTVTLNVACMLAQRRKVILVEMRPEFGSLAPYLTPHGLARNVSHALAGTPLSGCLWSSKTMPGLSVLFGPQTAAECGARAPDRVTALIRSLSSMADYVIVDLPPSLCDANRALIESSDSVELVVERDALCVQSARLMAQAIESWNGAPQPIELILVNRAALVSPMSLGDIEAQLGRSPLAVIPPSPDLCATAENMHIPLVVLQRESLIAESFAALSGSLELFIVAPTSRAYRTEPVSA